jgi:hypothetical protein
MFLLPENNRSEQLLGRFLIANKIIVDDKASEKAKLPQFIEFRYNLLRSLHSWPTAKGHNDIAEFTEKRATTRELYGTRGIALDLKQIEPGLGQPGHIRRLVLLVKLFITLARGKALDKFRPSLVCLAGKEYLAKTVEECFIDRSVRAANHGKSPHFAKNPQDLSHAILLDYHAGYANEIKSSEELKVYFFDIFVEKINLVIGNKTGEMGQRAGYHRTLYVSRVKR